MYSIFNNKWTAVLTGLFLVFSIMILSQCHTSTDNTPEWRYEVRGFVDYKGQKHEAIWYTDTIEIGDNYLRYENSDGSEVVIPSPFILIDHKYDKKQINNSNPFR